MQSNYLLRKPYYYPTFVALVSIFVFGCVAYIYSTTIVVMNDCYYLLSLLRSGGVSNFLIVVVSYVWDWHLLLWQSSSLPAWSLSRHVMKCLPRLCLFHSFPNLIIDIHLLNLPCPIQQNPSYFLGLFGGSLSFNSLTLILQLQYTVDGDFYF